VYQKSGISSSTIICEHYLNEELPRSFHDLSTCGQSWDRRSHCTRRRSKSDDDDDNDENEVSTALVTCVRKLKALWILCRLHRVVHITWVTEVTTCLFCFFLFIPLLNPPLRFVSFLGIRGNFDSPYAYELYIVRVVWFIFRKLLAVTYLRTSDPVRFNQVRADSCKNNFKIKMVIKYNSTDGEWIENI